MGRSCNEGGGTRCALASPVLRVAVECAAMVAVALGLTSFSAAASPSRPELDGREPLATCALQSLTENPARDSMAVVTRFGTIRSTVDASLDNYRRSSLGDWNVAGSVDRTDPWVRLLLLGPKRPLVIDLAVFIDGQPFRAAREAWIDGLLEGAKRESATADAQPTDEPSPDDSTADVAVQETSDTTPADVQTVVIESISDESSVEAPEESDSTSAGAVAESAEEPPSEVPSVEAISRQAPSLPERLASYVKATEAKVDREEIRWLAAEWGSGPALVVLGPGISWQRSDVAPLFRYLDQDGDGILAAEEVLQATSHVRDADIDGNDIVELDELLQRTVIVPPPPRAINHPLLTVLDEDTDWDALVLDLVRIYGGRETSDGTGPESGNTLKERARRGDPSLDAQQLSGLTNEPADVTVRVDLGSDEKHQTGVSLLSFADDGAAAEGSLYESRDVISFDLGVDYVELSAAQGDATKLDQASGHQIAVGAAIDGYPLLRLIDRNNDRRLTRRERGRLDDCLAGWDRNGDGRITDDETPIPIRLAVTLGAQVHELFASPSRAARLVAPGEQAKPPAWFASMDQNKDGDVSLNEFLGTSEQFRQFDADGDGLLSVSEALKLEGTQ